MSARRDHPSSFKVDIKRAKNRRVTHTHTRVAIVTSTQLQLQCAPRPCSSHSSGPMRVVWCAMHGPRLAGSERVQRPPGSKGAAHVPNEDGGHNAR